MLFQGSGFSSNEGTDTGLRAVVPTSALEPGKPAPAPTHAAVPSEPTPTTTTDGAANTKPASTEATATSAVPSDKKPTLTKADEHGMSATSGPLDDNPAHLA